MIMKSISYNIPLVIQGTSECLQASSSMLLQYYHIAKSLDDVKKEISVYVTTEGKPLGTSIGHIGSYWQSQGFETKIHCVDVEIFDRTWQSLSKEELIKNLNARKDYIKHHKYNKEIMDYIIDGYIEFIKKGGSITLPIIDENYLYTLLVQDPFIASVNYNFLQDAPKLVYPQIPSGQMREDSIEGETSTHAIIISGYDDGDFIIVDPYPKTAGRQKISSAQLIGAIYLAESDFDPLLISVEKN